MRSTLSSGSGFIRPAAIPNARSAASGLEKTNVDDRKTAGLAEPTDSRGSNPRVRTAVSARTSGCCGSCILGSLWRARALRSRLRLAECLHKRGHAGDVELVASTPFELADGAQMSERAPIRAVGRHGVVGIADRGDPRDQWDLVATQASREAAAVEPLVVVEDYVHDGLAEADWAEDVGADPRVLADLGPLVFFEAAGLGQNRVGHADL